ncbi:MAG: twin-arginine translocase subunit TatC [Bacteroidetes bacterium]|nr:twin-arginine translocase subunit TatC [Bacteroidota bacterium]
MAQLGLFNKSKIASGEMSFWGHIDALRGHLVRSVLVVLVITGVLFCFPEFLFDTIIFGPLYSDFITYRSFCQLSHFLDLGDQLCFGHYTFKLQSLGLGDQFTSLMWISFLGGVIIGSPYLLWEIWRFIKPALRDKEKKASTGFIIASTLLFLTGVLFSYYIIVPLSINFLGNYQVSKMVENNFTMDSYISTVTTLTLASGIVFELPVLVYFLTKFGLITPQFMRKYRKHAVVVILVAAAIITPSPDVTSQMLVAFPLYFLYEASIFVSSYVIKKQVKQKAI